MKPNKKGVALDDFAEEIERFLASFERPAALRMLTVDEAVALGSGAHARE